MSNYRGHFKNYSDEELKAVVRSSVYPQAKRDELDEERSERANVRQAEKIAEDTARAVRAEQRDIKRLWVQQWGLWVGIPAAILAVITLAALIAGVFQTADK